MSSALTKCRMKRREFITQIGSSAIAWPLASYAQEPKQPLKRVGILADYDPCPLQPNNPIVRRLRELGWVEGQTMICDCVSTFGRPVDQLPALARELVSLRPDVLMAATYFSVSALKQETTTIPIVMLGTAEPVRGGLITSLARPEANITGVAWLGLIPKRMELLREIVPNLRRVAYLMGVGGERAAYTPPGGNKFEEEERQIAASALGFTWQIFEAAVANDYDEIFARLAAEHFDAAYSPAYPLALQNVTRIAQLALRYRIPTVGPAAWWAKNGFLFAYGQNSPWGLMRAQDYVDKILRGAKPSDLPVEQATKYYLVINLQTAKDLGVSVPPSLIARTDEVIE
jgi:putative tryptophan/tyrosine transport system substrate-binding protein